MAGNNFPRVNGVPLIPEGSGTALAVPSGVLHVNSTQAGTGADTTETDLWSYSLPANTLSADGKILRVTVYGTYASDGNNKTLKLYFGGTALLSRLTAASGGGWRLEAIITRSGATAQIASAYLMDNNNGIATYTSSTPAETLSGAVTIRMSGTNGSAVANEIVKRVAMVEALN